MLLKRLIALLTCLSLMLAMILSWPATVAAHDQQPDMQKAGQLGADSDAVSTPFRTDAAVSAATLPHFGAVAYMPLLLTATPTSATADIGHQIRYVTQRIGPAPPFLASTSRHIYLRIRLLLI